MCVSIYTHTQNYLLQTYSHQNTHTHTLQTLFTLMAISPRKLRNDVYSYTYQNDSNTPLVISVLASLIERTLVRNERTGRKCGSTMSKTGSKIRVFDCYERPDMSILSYLERIFKYTKAGPSVYVVAYVYIDRFCRSQPEFRITAWNVHRLLITTIMVASKYVEDMNYRNSYFARVGGITTKEMNKLELDFLFLMNFKMHVNVSVFESYCCHLEREVSIGGGYHIEKTLRCAEELKFLQVDERGYNQIA
ncbi:putative cyclin PHO80, Cyclin-like superfamily [Helianthus annuus]|nr:putative cyclin PHO80, Cyclin-like superfamily [Helianthus annuus]